MHKEIGKIQSARFGYGGYQNAMFGFSVTLGGKGGWGCGDFWGTWSMEPSSSAHWTIDDQTKKWGDVVRRVHKICKEAGVNSVEELKDVPIEATFDSPIGRLLSWRILKEVL